MHANGVNHRDCYLVHMMVDANQAWPSKMYVMDLHRAQLRAKTPSRWIVKDIAGIYFSSHHLSLTRHDCFRFMREYDQLSLRDCLQQRTTFWRAVKRRGDKQFANFI